ncbi:DUF5986 family protein [Faecalispora anaeroviscerum]|uniref:DUF5986 family protein n=1 Tax=Faecalispora anaeroviscerum TaxID=2991836 RepID=UPI0024B8CB92|nr:DUF5986 family protein [Faecalispora anaeroviscerum]
MDKGFKLTCGEQFITKVVHCVNDAVGDSIREDTYYLKTKNSTPTRIWDILNTKLCNEMPKISCVADSTQRGSWQMVPVFSQEKRILFTFMRESRFEQLFKNLKKRKNPHYLDGLVNILNAKLLNNDQMTLYPIDLFDEDNMKDIVQKILFDLKVEREFIDHHALILFESHNFELISIRAVVIDKNMKIVYEENWNQYITADVSTIMQSATEFSTASNHPERGLKLSEKANKRKQHNIKVRPSETDDEENLNN